MMTAVLLTLGAVVIAVGSGWIAFEIARRHAEKKRVIQGVRDRKRTIDIRNL